ncbi:hypothetical protein ACLB2K_007496 [Fragaria x ananassa]
MIFQVKEFYFRNGGRTIPSAYYQGSEPDSSSEVNLGDYKLRVVTLPGFRRWWNFVPRSKGLPAVRAAALGVVRVGADGDSRTRGLRFGLAGEQIGSAPLRGTDRGCLIGLSERRARLAVEGLSQGSVGESLARLDT